MSSFDRSTGFGVETTYGISTTRTSFIDAISDNVKPRRITLEQRGHRAGRRVKPAMKVVTQGAEGSVQFEVGTAGLAMFLPHMLGPTTGVTGLTSTAFTSTLGNVAGKGLSYESNRPFNDGTAAVFVANGGKIKTWTLSAALNQTVDLELGLAFSTWQNKAVTKICTVALSTSVTVNNTDNLIVGMLVRGNGIPTATTVTAIDTTTKVVTISNAATVAGTGVTLSFGLDAQEVRTGDLASSTTVTMTAAQVQGLVAGLVVTGSGIPAETTVTAVGAISVTLSNAATKTATGVELVFSTPATVPSYVTSEPFAFSETSASIKWNGAAVGTDYCLVDLKITADLGLEDSQTFCGYGEPVAANDANITVDATIEWKSWDAYRRYFSDSQAETIAGFTITLTSPTPISAGVYPQLVINMPAVQLSGTMPDNQSGILRQPLTGVIVAPSTGSELSFVYTTATTAPWPTMLLQ